jgi:hypothetical protein
MGQGKEVLVWIGSSTDSDPEAGREQESLVSWGCS